MKISFLLFILSITTSFSQVSGINNPISKDYPSKCKKLKPNLSIKLNDSLVESSGLIAFDNLLWTHNDDRDNTIYGLDTLGKIRKKIQLKKVINTDWEEIAQDSSYIYVGDFGNNYKGNRSDLHILRIEKRSFLLNAPVIDTIAFSYSNQNDFSEQKQNTTNFDCEAFIISKDSIYLFTKEWSNKKTSIYSLPNLPGKHLAKFKETLNVKGLITGATYVEAQNTIVLCGYSKLVKPFIYLITDFKNFDFSSGNQQKIKLKLRFHQIEGIATQDGKIFYLINESFVKKPIANNPQQIHYFDLSVYLKP